MKRPTYELIREAAQKSKRAAVKSSREKYLYLLQLSPEELKRISLKFLCSDGCAICIRYDGTGECPLLSNCDGDCISEWNVMRFAWENYCDPVTSNSSHYFEFITYVAKIYLKLLEI